VFRGLGTDKRRKFWDIGLKKPNRCDVGAGERF
jgi:hypothetical protein